MTRIATLGPGDLLTMRRMLAMFGDAFDDVATYTSRQPHDDYLRGLLAGDTFLAVAAIDKDEVVGGLAGYFLPKFEQARREFYIYDLAVAQAHRRQGVATRLIAHLMRETAERDVHAVFVQADLGDGPAIALYEKLGRREDVLHFDLR
jgi:ribosomal protein S18 acetylase RimI-like enzyme